MYGAIVENSLPGREPLLKPDGIFHARNVAVESSQSNIICSAPGVIVRGYQLDIEILKENIQGTLATR